jgi:hypothetical protein
MRPGAAIGVVPPLWVTAFTRVSSVEYLIARAAELPLARRRVGDGHHEGVAEPRFCSG